MEKFSLYFNSHTGAPAYYMAKDFSHFQLQGIQVC